jgi:hypothetical protein
MANWERFGNNLNVWIAFFCHSALSVKKIPRQICLEMSVSGWILKCPSVKAGNEVFQDTPKILSNKFLTQEFQKGQCPFCEGFEGRSLPRSLRESRERSFLRYLKNFVQ